MVRRENRLKRLALLQTRHAKVESQFQKGEIAGVPLEEEYIGIGDFVRQHLICSD